MKKTCRSFLKVCPSVRQRGSTSDSGFLSSAEYSIWASTMKLSDDEAQPTLRESHFLSLDGDPPPQVSPLCHRPPRAPTDLPWPGALTMLRHVVPRRRAVPETRRHFPESCPCPSGGTGSTGPSPPTPSTTPSAASTSLK